jgi:pimeloyl-ACP methyl ester carboxylesterase
MSRLRRNLLIAGLSAGVLLGGAFYGLNRASSGIIGFYAWKFYSGQAHGGEYADVNGIKLYAETFGDAKGAGTPVLALHGGTGFIESMHYQVTALADRRFVIAPDSRAHGRSGDADGPLHYAQMADDMIALLDQKQIAKVDIVGWSDGGIIGLDMAMRYPERVGRLVTIGANYSTDGIAHQSPNHWAELTPDAEIFASARKFYQRIAPEPDQWPVFFEKIIAMWRNEPNFTVADLGKITAPTLVMAGELDTIKREHSESMAAAIPSAKLVIIKGADHFGPLRAPQATNPPMLEFLGVSR